MELSSVLFATHSTAQWDIAVPIAVVAIGGRILLVRHLRGRGNGRGRGPRGGMGGGGSMGGGLFGSGPSGGSKNDI